MTRGPIWGNRNRTKKSQNFKTITMKTFGVVREENKKSTRKKMPKIRLFCSLNVTGILTPFHNLSKQCYNLSCTMCRMNFLSNILTKPD